MEKSNSSKFYDAGFYNYVWGFSISLIAITFILLSFMYCVGDVDMNFELEKSARLGDTIGGITNPLVGVLAIAITFLAFWVQYKANQAQTEQFNNQAKDLAVERFESKFYQLLSMHRSNVNEILIQTENDPIKGRIAIIEMFYEFRHSYGLIENFTKLFNKDSEGIKAPDEKESLMNLSYIVFMLGVGFNSNKLIKDIYEKMKYLEYKTVLVTYLENKALDYALFSDIAYERFLYKLKFKPMNGHLSRLPHYFRHLFDIVQLLDKEKSLTVHQKINYANSLRAQLSDYEQLLLYYNVCSIYGQSWINPENNLMKKYRLIKNMPLAMADFGVKPQEKFKKEIAYWKNKGESFINGI